MQHRSIPTFLFALVVGAVLVLAGCDAIGTEEDGDEDSENGTDGTFVELSSDISSDRTLTADEQYLVTTSISVEGDATLTIEPGVYIEFEANTALSVDNNNASLVASGTASDSIKMVGTQSDAGGWWQGIGIYSTHPNNELDHVHIEDAGSESWGSMGSAGSVAINGGNQLTLTNSTIKNGGAYGLYLDESDADLTFSGNTFSGNETAPMSVPFTVIGEIDSGSTFESGTYVAIWGANPSSGDISVDALDVPYRIAGTPGLDGDVTLTIDAGVEMEFTANSNITVNSNDAALIASGASGDEISMVGTQQDASGWWQGIGIYSTNPSNELDYVHIADAGSESWGSMGSAGSVAINSNNQLTLTNSTIENGGAYGLYLDEADADLTFSNNAFSGNETAPMSVPFTVIGEIDAGSSFESGTHVRIWDANPSSGDISVDALDVPYRIAGTPGLDGDVTLTIDPGVTMEFTANSNITVNSNNANLVVNGESGSEVMMTATPGNKNQGFWQGLGFYSNNPNNEVTYTTIEYAGGQEWGSMSAAANIGLNSDAQLNLEHSTINDSGQHGVYCDEPADATLTRSGNSFNNNAGLDVDC